ncbi:hypothetical protein BT96DRAFT_998603 [Gymnopus androsaceus JB14]|uniref:Uncharacterized protein n=1 Tax=Gymnopus androsaceus JB14 TaxID=1447944 RepID=A0A6A4H7V1_9AGAR|nr:hypothetical protein BT96DRAFT_998603 [Gymnopus androsaceus JB14]
MKDQEADFMDTDNAGPEVPSRKDNTTTSTGEWATATLISAATGVPDLTLANTGFVATTVIGSVTYTVSTPSTTVVSTTTSYGASGAVTMLSISGSFGPDITLATSGFQTVIAGSTYTVAPSNAASSLRPLGFTSPILTGLLAMAMGTLLGGFVYFA